MERVQVIALAALVSALALFGAGLLVDRRGPGLADGSVVAGSVADGARGVRLWSSERESRRGPRAGGPGVQPPEQRRGRRTGAAGADVDADGALVAGGGRRVVGIGAGGSDDGELGADGISGDLLAARTGTLPRAGGGSEPARHEVEMVDADPPDEQPQDPGGVLLSIPLQGSVNPEQGGSPTQADGVVVDGDAVDFTEEAQYTLPAGGHVDGAMGTIAFDVEPHWAGSDTSDNSLLQIRDEHEWPNNLQIVKNGDSLRFIIIDAAGAETNVNVYIDDWQAGESHHVAATWDGEQMVLYVDRQQVGQAALSNGLSFKDTTPIHVGSDFPDSTYRGANARISHLTIYGRALGASEIS